MSSHGSLGEKRVLAGHTLLVLIRRLFFFTFALSACVTEYDVNALCGYKESIIQIQGGHLL